MKIDQRNGTVTISKEELREAFSSSEKYRRFNRNLMFNILTKIYNYTSTTANYVISQWDFDFRRMNNNAQTQR